MILLIPILSMAPLNTSHLHKNHLIPSILPSNVTISVYFTPIQENCFVGTHIFPFPFQIIALL